MGLPIGRIRLRQQPGTVDEQLERGYLSAHPEADVRSGQRRRAAADGKPPALLRRGEVGVLGLELGAAELRGEPDALRFTATPRGPKKLFSVPSTLIWLGVPVPVLETAME